MNANRQISDPSACNARQAFEENRRATEKVRMELNRLRQKMCESEENMAALDDIIEDVLQRRTARRRFSNDSA